MGAPSRPWATAGASCRTRASSCPRMRRRARARPKLPSRRAWQEESERTSALYRREWWMRSERVGKLCRIPSIDCGQGGLAPALLLLAHSRGAVSSQKRDTSFSSAFKPALSPASLSAVVFSKSSTNLAEEPTWLSFPHAAVYSATSLRTELPERKAIFARPSTQIMRVSHSENVAAAFMRSKIDFNVGVSAVSSSPRWASTCPVSPRNQKSSRWMRCIVLCMAGVLWKSRMSKTFRCTRVRPSCTWPSMMSIQMRTTSSMRKCSGLRVARR
mmetsp:Transcript_423/g.1469  ORF Transcript_423/g.1469 Transcript_423/m.1469 type:complete len:272 (-) Transcript_423:1565-2380(-)